MEMRVVIAGRDYRVRLDAARSLAIPLDFAGRQPSFFGAPRASATPLRLPDLVGSTEEGGSCNVAELRLIPHCNGTHIETVGHIVNDPVALAHVVGASLFSGRLVTIAPSSPGTVRRAMARHWTPEIDWSREGRSKWPCTRCPARNRRP